MTLNFGLTKYGCQTTNQLYPYLATKKIHQQLPHEFSTSCTPWVYKNFWHMRPPTSMEWQKRPPLKLFAKKHHLWVAAPLARRHVARAAWASTGTNLTPVPFPARCRLDDVVSPCGPCRLGRCQHAYVAACHHRRWRHPWSLPSTLIPTQIGSFVLTGKVDFFSFSRASRNGADF
jgi:hypothetical protein